MSRNLIITTISITVLCTFLFFIGFNRITVQNQIKGGLKIKEWSSGLGGGIGNDLDKSKLPYSIYLTNENKKNIFIQSIQPLVNEQIKNKILSKEMVVTVNKDIKPNETIHITGEVIVDTKGLTTADMVKLEPFITDIKVITAETISLK